MTRHAQTSRAAIYARFSTDLQRDRSIDDQIALCRSFAERSGHEVVAIYHDRARSGASIFGRDGLVQLIEASRARAFDVVIVEALDRLSRDQEDLAGLYKRLTFQGIKIIAVHDGAADPVQIGVRGMLGSLYLLDLANKVRRGMDGVIRDGRHAGGRAYGYRPVPGKPGELEIVHEEAEVVRRIFMLYRGGMSPRAIAGLLNRDGVPPPRGRKWNASTINGNMARGYGIIQNPLYRGQIVWNRVRMVLDPDTGKRISRPNPQSEWRYADAPHLRIVEDEIAEAAMQRKEETSHHRTAKGPRAKRMLSGLLKCGCCGGGMTIIGRDRSGPRIQCSTFRESGSCTNGARYYVEKIERIVLDALRQQLADPELITAYIKRYQAQRRALAAEARRQRTSIERRLSEVESAIKRLIDALADGAIEKDDVAERMAGLKAERDDLKRQLALAGKDRNVIELHPTAMERYRENVAQLGMIMNGSRNGNPPWEIVQPLREVIDSVIVMPRTSGRPYEVRIMGVLSALTGQEIWPTGVSAIAMVAEARSSRYSRTQVIEIIDLGMWRGFGRPNEVAELAA